MKVMVVGSGGREHALAWKLAQSPLADEVICAPGNPGAEDVARRVAPSSGGVDGLVDVASHERVTLVVVGPEAELGEGLVDRLAAEGIPAFGPTAAAARLETQKSFAKEVMADARVATARFSVHDDLEGALRAADERRGRCVVKADGLAAGKGVVVCESMDEAEAGIRAALIERRFGDAGAKVLVEDRLEGEELSVLALSDGERLVSMVAAQDHKAVFDGGKGPNTGGMGAFAPARLGGPRLLDDVRTTVLEPTIATMARRGTPLRGVLYAGLMVCEGRPYVLEFNVRFGDPETQPLMLLLAEDLLPRLAGAARGELDTSPIRFRAGTAVCVVMASGGYPGRYRTGLPIEGLAAAARQDHVAVFHAGTARVGDQIVTAGGRVLGVTAWGLRAVEARDRAYRAVSAISFDGEHHRRDIAAAAE